MKSICLLLKFLTQIRKKIPIRKIRTDEVREVMNVFKSIKKYKEADIDGN